MMEFTEFVAVLVLFILLVVFIIHEALGTSRGNDEVREGEVGTSNVVTCVQTAETNKREYVCTLPFGEVDTPSEEGEGDGVR